MKRRAFLSGTTALLVTAHIAAAQETHPTKKLGVLASWPPEIDADPFRMRLSSAFSDELRRHGWIEGKNLVIERRFAAGRIERLPALAAELVSLNVDVIYAAGGTPGRAAKAATSTIPIVTLSSDMIGQGLVSNLARPEGNVTGQNIMMVELASKRLHLLRELLPRASRSLCSGAETIRLPERTWGFHGRMLRKRTKP